jgi:ATP-dependent protease ClpP protease subunit
MTLNMQVEKLNENKKGYYGNYDEMEFEVTVQPMHSLLYKIKLFGPIENTNQFNSALEAFERATPDDRVLIHLSTPGGNVDAADTFINSMNNCQAPVHIMATGGVHSAGTIILLAAESFSLSDNFYALLHNGSTGSYGKMSDYKAESRFSAEYMDNLMRKTYAGFLSDTEIEQLIEGKDFWMGPKEWCERADRRNELEAAQAGSPLEKLENAAMELEALITKVKATTPQVEEVEEEAPAPKPKRKRKTVAA